MRSGEFIYMFDMKGDQWLVALMEPTVFAAAIGPFDDSTAPRRVHQDARCPANHARALACRTEMRSSVWT
jgi:hypothetical protein